MSSLIGQSSPGDPSSGQGDPGGQGGQGGRGSRGIRGSGWSRWSRWSWWSRLLAYMIQKIYGVQGLNHQIIEKSLHVTPVTDRRTEDGKWKIGQYSSRPETAKMTMERSTSVGQ